MLKSRHKLWGTTILVALAIIIITNTGKVDGAQWHWGDISELGVTIDVAQPNECSELEPSGVSEYVENIKGSLEDLLNIGMDPQILENLKIVVVPSYSCKRPYKLPWEDESKLWVGGLTKIDYRYEEAGQDKYKMTCYPVLMTSNNSMNTFMHEMGHVIEYRKLFESSGLSQWDLGYIQGEQYILLKQYPYIQKGMEQYKEPWENRASEWFAEDVKCYIMSELNKTGKYNIPIYNTINNLRGGKLGSDNSLEDTDDLGELIHGLIFSDEGDTRNRQAPEGVIYVGK